MNREANGLLIPQSISTKKIMYDYSMMLIGYSLGIQHFLHLGDDYLPNATFPLIPWQWRPAEMLNFIFSLDGGLYRFYEDKLRETFSIRYTCDGIPKIHMLKVDVHCVEERDIEEWGITDPVDRNELLKHFIYIQHLWKHVMQVNHLLVEYDK